MFGSEIHDRSMAEPMFGPFSNVGSPEKEWGMSCGGYIIKTADAWFIRSPSEL